MCSLNSAMSDTKLVHLVIFKSSPVHGSIETWLSPLGTMLIQRKGERFVIWLITRLQLEYEKKGDKREFSLHLIGCLWPVVHFPQILISVIAAGSRFEIIHQIPEGHVGVYWRGGALLKTISEPGESYNIDLLWLVCSRTYKFVLTPGFHYLHSPL